MKNIILAHKDFIWTEYLFDEPVVYTQRDNLKTNLPVVKYGGPDDRVYGEFSIWKWLAENETNDDEWFTLHHYRRKFDPYYNHLSLPTPISFNCTVADQLAYYHSPELADFMVNYLKQPIDKINIFFPYNIFSAPLRVIKEWVAFVEPFIKMGEEKLKITSYEEANNFIKEHASFTKQENGKNTEVSYQSRIWATVTERLNTLFWMNYKEPAYYCGVKLLETDMVM